MTHTAEVKEVTLPAFEASELIEYGKIEEITQAGQAANPDGNGYS